MFKKIIFWTVDEMERIEYNLNLEGFDYEVVFTDPEDMESESGWFEVLK